MTLMFCSRRSRRQIDGAGNYWPIEHIGSWPIPIHEKTAFDSLWPVAVCASRRSTSESNDFKTLHQTAANDRSGKEGKPDKALPRFKPLAAGEGGSIFSSGLTSMRNRPCAITISVASAGCMRALPHQNY